MPATVATTELGPVVVGVMWFQTVLALVMVVLRLYSRGYLMSGKFGWDDFLMVLTMLLFIAYSAFCTAATRFGFGRHMSEVEPAQFSFANMLEIVGQTMLLAAIATSKGSVAVFLLRITIRRWHKLILSGAMLVLTGLCLFCALLNFLQCDPISKVWNVTLPGHCWMSVTPVAIATGALSVVVDFLLAALPWNIVYSLNMGKRERLSIALSLSLGIFAGVCGIIRTYELQGLSSLADYSYDTVPLVLWSASELLITIFSANFPIIRPLIRKVTGRSQNETPVPMSSRVTVGSQPIRRNRKKSSEWAELEEVSLATALAVDSERGINTTVITHSDPKRSSSYESMLREARMDKIEIRDDVRVVSSPAGYDR